MSKESTEQAKDPMSKRLDAIIRLLMEEQFQAGKLKKKDQLIILDSVGLTSGEIGRIVDRPSKDVASDLKKMKAKPKSNLKGKRALKKAGRREQQEGERVAEEQ